MCDEIHGDDKILSCIKCKNTLHNSCFLLNKIENNYICDYCVENTNNEKRICCVCPNTEGAFTKTTEGKWIHIVCVQCTL